MPTDRLILFGAGGHASVVIDALQSRGEAENILLCSDDPAQTGQSVLGHRIVLFEPQLAEGADFHICIGNVSARRSMHMRLLAAGARPQTILHPSAIVARSALVGAGAFIAAGAIVSAEASIGLSAIVNHAAIVDHQSRVGDFSHIAPGATIAGNVRIGEQTLIGAGANVLPGIEVGQNCVVGAGAVLTRSIADDQKFAGIPARRMT